MGGFAGISPNIGSLGTSKLAVPDLWESRLVVGKGLLMNLGPIKRLVRVSLVVRLSQRFISGLRRKGPRNVFRGVSPCSCSVP